MQPCSNDCPACSWTIQTLIVPSVVEHSCLVKNIEVGLVEHRNVKVLLQHANGTLLLTSMLFAGVLGCGAAQTMSRYAQNNRIFGELPRSISRDTSPSGL
jgi:hypothetical protein